MTKPNPRTRRPMRVDEQVDSVVSQDRMDTIARLCKQVELIDGYAAEIGVYRGGTARVICASLPDKQIYLFDTFEGLPQETSKDNIHIKGDFADTSVSRVVSFLRPYNNFTIKKGHFPESFGVSDTTYPCAFAHLDVDLHQSMKECLETMYPRMSVGGIIVMDDYLAPTCEGATKAITEFFADKPEKLQSIAQYQAYIVKQ